MLGVIAGMMKSFNLTLDQVAHHYEYIMNLNENEITGEYIPIEPSSSSDSGGYAGSAEYTDSQKNDLSESESDDHKSIYVKTRREFCTAMSKGIRICPKYSTCVDSSCDNFHIAPENICNHVTRGNYCDDSECEKIVIKACKRRQKCTDDQCSFRHN
jgi:hypothetical protein